MTRTGRRFANSPRPLRSPSRPCSGRGRVGVGRVPLRPADGAEQHRVGGRGSARAPRAAAACRARRSRRRRPASSLDLEAGVEARRERRRAAARAAPIDLGADAVAGQGDDRRVAAARARRRPALLPGPSRPGRRGRSGRSGPAAASRCPAACCFWSSEICFSWSSSCRDCVESSSTSLGDVASSDELWLFSDRRRSGAESTWRCSSALLAVVVVRRRRWPRARRSARSRRGSPRAPPRPSRTWTRSCARSIFSASAGSSTTSRSTGATAAARPTTRRVGSVRRLAGRRVVRGRRRLAPFGVSLAKW